MNIPVTLTLSLLAALVGNVVKKYYTDRTAGSRRAGFVFNAVSSLAAAAVLLAWGGFGTPSAFTLALGTAFGAITALQGLAMLAALQCGPMSYTVLIITLSTVISALSGALFFGESLGWAQIVGIALMLVSFALATEKKDEEARAGWKWMLLCLVAFACTGGIGIMQKVHQESAWASELNPFLVVAFFTATLLCTLFSFGKMCKKADNVPKKSTQKAKKQALLLLGVMLLCGVTVAANNKFNLYLSGVMESAVFFPVVNGGGLILTTLSALLIFRERLSLRQWIGLAVGIASVIFLCNPFA